MTEFKVGDRVKYIGTETPELIGKTGTVVPPLYVGDEDVRVAWNEKPFSWKGDNYFGVYPYNLALEEDPQKFEAELIRLKLRVQELEMKLDDEEGISDKYYREMIKTTGENQRLKDAIVNMVVKANE